MVFNLINRAIANEYTCLNNIISISNFHVFLRKNLTLLIIIILYSIDLLKMHILKPNFEDYITK